MNNQTNGMSGNRDSQLEQELNGLRRQYEQLRDHKVRTEQQVSDLTSRLEALKGQAEAEFGTSDPKELQALLEKRRKENERIVTEYREHIEKIQNDLKRVESSVGGDE